MPATVAPATRETSIWPSIPGRLPLTEDSVQRTLGIGDPAVRNLWITQAYADLARRLLSILGTDQTWCTFAIWASDTAGVSIRGRELPHVIDHLLPGAEAHLDATLGVVAEHTSRLRRTGLARALDRSHLEHIVARAVRQVSADIAHGNTIVFGELAPLFVRLVRALETAAPPSPNAVDGYLDALSIPGASEQPLVRTAFRHYALAATADLAPRAQHVLTANIAAVLHEQQRLQPDIEAALDAAVIDLGDDLAGTLHHLLPRPIRVRVVAAVRHRAAPHLEQLWRHVATRMLMTLTVPDGVLHLDRDVPPLPDGTRFPPALQHVALDELRALIAAWDATAGTGDGAGARDWAELHQRMTYIVNLFRSRQQHLALTAPPFTTAQLAWMARGEVPPTL